MKTWILMLLLLSNPSKSDVNLKNRPTLHVSNLHELVTQAVQEKNVTVKAYKNMHRLLALSNNQQIATTKRMAIKSTCYLGLITYYRFHRESDSVIKYHQLLQQTTKSNTLLGKAQIELAKNYSIQNVYYKASRCYHKALNLFKDNENLYNRISVYLELTKLYKNIGNLSLARKTDSLLMKGYLPKINNPYFKQLIKINHASLKKEKQSLAILQSINVNVLKEKSAKKYYYTELARSHLALNNQDSTKKYIEKAFEAPLLASLTDDVHKNIFLAALSLKNGNHKKTLDYLHRTKCNARYSSIEDFNKLEVMHMLHKANEYLKNYKDAFVAFKEYHSLQNSIKKQNEQIAFFESQITYDNKILALKEKNNSTIFGTFLVTAFLISVFFPLALIKIKKSEIKLLGENRKLKSIAECKNRYIENLYHEMNTPITIITGYLSLIANNPIDYAKVISYTHLAKISTQNIANSLTNLLTLSKLENKPLLKNVVSASLGDFIKENIVLYKSMAETKNLSIFFASNINSKKQINYDYDSLKKILNNLISNAIKYSLPKNAIYFAANIHDKELIIKVIDKGIGIKKEEQQLIFDRFYQSEQNQLYGGFGIGLSLVKELVTALNGSISLKSTNGVGSIFTVCLPLNIDESRFYIEESNFQFKNITTLVKATNETLKDAPSILIVDDNPGILKYINELLSQKFNCIFAFDGRDAINKVQNQKFNLIIADLRMPFLNGYELKEKLNQNPLTSSIPFILMSTSISKEDNKDKLDSLGIKYHLKKPFKGTQLLAKVTSLVAKQVYQKQLQTIKINEVTYDSAFSTLMKKVNTIVLKHLNDKDFNVNKLAEMCNYSHNQFTQIIKSKSGLSPVKLILEIRLLKAYQFILNKSYLSMNEVIFAVGLNSRGYFNKVFFEKFGIKPGELMKKVKLEKNLV